MTKEEIKFAQEELDKIKEFQQRYVNIQLGFGQAEITKMRLETQLENINTAMDSLKEQLSTTQKEEQEFIADVNKKYGDGVLNPETGVFTPNTDPDTVLSDGTLSE